jgi:hypothetical protein
VLKRHDQKYAVIAKTQPPIQVSTTTHIYQLHYMTLNQ